MPRRLLIFLSWSGVLGAVLDAMITLFAAWEIIYSSDVQASMTVEEHLLKHLPFLYFLKHVGYAFAPDALIDWIFRLPALAYFPFRIFINLLFGWWMLRWARALERRDSAS